MAYSDGKARNALMAGYPQVALFGGEKAQGADLAALERAKAIQKQGGDPWSEGWFQDQTGWSFEIGDDGYAEQGNALMPMQGRVITRPYGQTYTHPELARQYPDFMSRSRVTVDSDLAKREDVDGMVTEGNRVWVDPLLPTESRLSTGLHETQHALDNHEGRRRFQSRDYLQDPREQRAFNVEYRRGLTPQQRRQLSPTETLPAALNAYRDTD